MQARTVERVESWDSRPFSGGVGQLHDLADADFSGAVDADGTWLFFLNGRVIGVFDGDMDRVADADGTVYEAPDESVALLYAMRHQDGETQAKYYTNDTPLSEASQTLTDANFTGYIELSENVLSGDYYVVYYGGRSMSAAFIGTREELHTGDEAFERADDEVGVYEVVKAPVSVTELPERPDDGDDTPAETAAHTTTAADDASTDSEATTEDASPPAGEGGVQSAASDGGASAATTSEASPTAPTSAERAADADSGASTAAQGSGAPGSASQPADGEQAWQETTSVPTISPADSEGEQPAGRSGASASTTNASAPSTSSSSSAAGGRQSTLEKLKRAVKKREQKLQAASERIDTLKDERDDLRSTVSTLERERDELQAEVASLEETVSSLEEEVAASEPADAAEDAGAAGVTLSAEDALAGTDLFVRYDSKGKPTLDELDATTDPDAVNGNLRVDHHTQFDTSAATVDGTAFESFLADSAAYTFVSWTVRALPYEIRESGHQSGLSELYAALPSVDRAELRGTVEVSPDDETTISRTFDVVLRDRMGNALVVADINTGRDPVTAEEMAALVSDATAIREGTDHLAAAMYVTGSFFEPAALETAGDATASGGLLSRSDRESFVNVGRKAGYHLCLVEDRDDAFHLTVPEL
ncbi:hypothetical protein JT689_05705 [Halobacterium sp. GSL-19]|uniref:cell division protein ZapB n=2 Tax=Halobacterium TaxID=2239 RepID=UPI0019639800|nr:cell division protein ZapB [Halobacterium sp. GSL-19]QRY23523.1 hypothetical protein JT689_05705 [Halobacterium sp. GSL-19]